MAYNNGFPMSYQQYYPQYQQQYPVSQNSNLIWVQGEAGAKSYMVAPNSTVQLWDSEENVIYIKSTDASGMPSMKVLDYKIREGHESKNKFNGDIDYATKSEVSKEISRLEKMISDLTGTNHGGELVE